MKFFASLVLLFAVCVLAQASNYGVAFQQVPQVQSAPVCQSCQPAIQQQIVPQQAPAVQYQVVPQQQFVPQVYQMPAIQQQVIQQRAIVVRQAVHQQFAPAIYSSPVLSQQFIVGRSAIAAQRAVVVRGGLFRPRVVVRF